MQFGTNQNPLSLSHDQLKKLSEVNLIFYSMNSIERLIHDGFFTRDGNLINFFNNTNIFRSFLVIDGFRPLIRTPYKKKIELLTSKVTSKVNDNIELAELPSILPYDQRNSLSFKLNRYICGKIFLPRYIKNKDGKLVTWISNVLLIPLALMIQSDLVVFDAIDDWREREAYRNDKRMKSILEKCYSLVNSKANIVFSVSHKMALKFEQDVKIAKWVPNGFNDSLFTNNNLKVANDLPKNYQRIIGYVGNIESRFDTKLIFKLAKNFPEYGIVIIGPFLNKKIEETLSKSYSNIHLLGQKKYNLIPSYISGFDVAIIPHKQTALTESMNPLKVYEYLAMGKPIVAFGTTGIDKLEGVRVANNHDQFISLIKQAIHSPWAVPLYEDTIKKYSWRHRVNEMLNTIAIEI